jgi:hypothetical protein
MTTRPSIHFQPRRRGELIARLTRDTLSTPQIADDLIILRNGAVAGQGGHYYYVARSNPPFRTSDIAGFDLP